MAVIYTVTSNLNIFLNYLTVKGFIVLPFQGGAAVTGAVAESVRALFRKRGLPHLLVRQQVFWGVRWKELHVCLISRPQEVSKSDLYCCAKLQLAGLATTA